MTAHGKYQIFANTGHFKVNSHLLLLVPNHFIVSHAHLPPLPLNLWPPIVPSLHPAELVDALSATLLLMLIPFSVSTPTLGKRCCHQTRE